MTPGRHRRADPVSRRAVIVLALLLLGVSLYAVTTARGDGYTRVVGYASWEHLTGCYAPGRCRTACGQLLNDRRYTVAANPAWGLGCGAKIRLCRVPGRRCVLATVTDRTASVFGFELTYALARATGAPARGWDGPRALWWERVYRRRTVQDARMEQPTP